MQLTSNRKIIIPIILVSAILFRIWLAQWSNWQVNIQSYYDQHREVNQVSTLINGLWEYNKFILCKGISYPLFLAGLYILNIPFGMGYALLIVLASLIFVKAISPLLKKTFEKLLIALFMMYNPVGYTYEALTFSRNTIVPWFVLISLSSLIAIYLRKDQTIKTLIPWSFISFLSAGFFGNIREDSIWYLPVIIVFVLLLTVHFWKNYDVRK